MILVIWNLNWKNDCKKFVSRFCEWPLRIITFEAAFLVKSDIHLEWRDITLTSLRCHTFVTSAFCLVTLPSLFCNYRITVLSCLCHTCVTDDVQIILVIWDLNWKNDHKKFISRFCEWSLRIITFEAAFLVKTNIHLE